MLAGASGFLGSALRTRLASEGHEVRRLVRREPATSTEYRWDPRSGDLDRAVLDDIEIDWLDPEGQPGLVSATFETAQGRVRI